MRWCACVIVTYIISHDRKVRQQRKNGPASLASITGALADLGLLGDGEILVDLVKHLSSLSL